MTRIIMSAVTNTDKNDEPRNSQETWYHQNKEKRQNWRVAICKEFKDMIQPGVWDVIERISIPEGRRLIGSKWVFKEKRDGRFRARLVCLSYSQIQGVDFSDNYAPVGNDITFRVIMVLRLIYNLHAVLLDIETAFIYGKLEEEIYMEIPLGYKAVYADPGSDKVLVLKMALYGLVQTARQWFKHLSDILITLGFNPCISDPCLMYRINEEGLCIILMYVDDNLIVGSRKAIDKATKEIKAFFSVMVSLIATEYLGCEINVAENYSCGWIVQPDLYKNLEKNSAIC